jgi:predicted nucleic acid-binding protein
VPNPEDWMTASRIAYALAQERKHQAGGQAPKQTAKVKQEIAFDCLLAASAAREGVTVVTLDRNDFQAIRRHCKNLSLIIVKS